MTSPRPLRHREWQQVAAEQDGVLGRRQALRFGLTAAAWNWQLTTGRWRAVVPGVAITHSGVPTDAQRAWAAVLHGGYGAALSGDAGLIALGVTVPAPSHIDLVVPWPRQVQPHPLLGGPELRCHAVRNLVPWLHPVREPTVLLLEPAALHAAAWAATDRAAEWRLAAVVQQRRTTAGTLRRYLAEMPRLPRRRLIREVLDDIELGAHAGSELAFLRFCRVHGLPSPDELQVLVRANGKHYLDARYRRQRVCVELDGAHHMEVRQWDADSLRGLRLAVAHRETGEALVRITKGNLRHDAAEVAALLRQLLR